MNNWTPNVSFEPIRRNRKYVPNLAAQQAESANNYLLLNRLMGLLNEDREALFGVPGQGQILLTETQRSPYTSFVTLVGLDRAEWLQVPQLDVRMYHDARMAEIVAFQRARHLAGRYEYPNPNMYQRDEKAQQNRYLAELLALCLAEGRLTDTVSPWAPHEP